MLCKNNSLSSINEIFSWIAQNIQITWATAGMEQGISTVHVYFLSLPERSLQLFFAEEW